MRKPIGISSRLTVVWLALLANVATAQEICCRNSLLRTAATTTVVSRCRAWPVIVAAVRPTIIARSLVRTFRVFAGSASASATVVSLGPICADPYLRIILPASGRVLAVCQIATVRQT